MSPDQVAAIIHESMVLVVVVSMPPVLLGLLVGLIIAVFQAVTQVQEQTLGFVPKMVIVLFAFSYFFSWMMRSIVELTIKLWSQIPFYSV